MNVFFTHTPCVIPKITHLLTTTELSSTRCTPASRSGLSPAAWPGPGCSSARAPACVGGSVVPGPRFRCVCLAGTRTLAFLWAKGSGNGSPWRGPPHFNPAGIQSWREPARAENPSRRIPRTPPKSGCARGSDPPSPHRVCASLPPNRAHRVPDEGDPEESLAPPPRPAVGTPKAARAPCPGWAGQSSLPRSSLLIPSPHLISYRVAWRVPPPPALGDRGEEDNTPSLHPREIRAVSRNFAAMI